MLALVLQSQLVSVGNGNPRAPLQQPADDEQIEAAPTKYKGLKDAGLDRPLVFPDWDAQTAADRSLVYDKGTLVVHGRGLPATHARTGANRLKLQTSSGLWRHPAVWT